MAEKFTLVRPQSPNELPRVKLEGHVIVGAAFTCNVAVVEAVSVAEVAAFTRNVDVPAGVPALVVRVSVPVAELFCEATWIGFGVKLAATPVGSEKAVRSAVKFPELPDPVPRFTVTA